MKSFASPFAESHCLAGSQSRLSTFASCCLLVAALGGFSITPTQAAESVAKPNIIVIMGDDVGYGDVSCNGATAITTPNIDALAERGLRFTSGYLSLIHI